MGKRINPAVLLEAAAMLASIAREVEVEAPVCGCHTAPRRPLTPPRPLGCGCTNRTAPRRVVMSNRPLMGGRPFVGECIGAPQGPWGVAEVPPVQDKNKVFGINVRVDEPRASDYWNRAQFERDHAKFDRLVEAAEACTWSNKSNTAPLTKVNAIRRRIIDGVPTGINLCGETEWFD